MVTLVDATLLEEARRLALRFACEDCAHRHHDEERCSLGFRASPPRRATLEQVATLEFCKSFELA
ncbi:MAG: hypothetical protein IT376_07625 [Polyangiaceae bacterium]|nr:hypothetical protein [Polyangiaceae bacterium]